MVSAGGSNSTSISILLVLLLFNACSFPVAARLCFREVLLDLPCQPSACPRALLSVHHPLSRLEQLESCTVLYRTFVLSPFGATHVIRDGLLQAGPHFGGEESLDRCEKASPADVHPDVHPAGGFYDILDLLALPFRPAKHLWHRRTPPHTIPGRWHGSCDEREG